MFYFVLEQPHLVRKTTCVNALKHTPAEAVLPPTITRATPITRTGNVPKTVATTTLNREVIFGVITASIVKSNKFKNV